MLCFTNDQPQRDGAHLAGFHAALARTITSYTHAHGMAEKEKVPIADDDARMGLTAVLAVRTADPRLSGYSRDKLISAEVRTVVERIVGDQLATWLAAHPGEAKVILAKAGKAASARAICDFALRPRDGRPWPQQAALQTGRAGAVL